MTNVKNITSPYDFCTAAGAANVLECVEEVVACQNKTDAAFNQCDSIVKAKYQKGMTSIGGAAPQPQPVAAADDRTPITGAALNTAIAQACASEANPTACVQSITSGTMLLASVTAKTIADLKAKFKGTPQVAVPQPQPQPQFVAQAPVAQVMTPQTCFRMGGTYTVTPQGVASCSANPINQPNPEAENNWSPEFESGFLGSVEAAIGYSHGQFGNTSAQSSGGVGGGTVDPGVGGGEVTAALTEEESTTTTTTTTTTGLGYKNSKFDATGEGALKLGYIGAIGTKKDSAWYVAADLGVRGLRTTTSGVKGVTTGDVVSGVFGLEIGGFFKAGATVMRAGVGMDAMLNGIINGKVAAGDLIGATDKFSVSLSPKVSVGVMCTSWLEWFLQARVMEFQVQKVDIGNIQVKTGPSIPIALTTGLRAYFGSIFKRVTRKQ